MRWPVLGLAACWVMHYFTNSPTLFLVAMEKGAIPTLRITITHMSMNRQQEESMRMDTPFRICRLGWLCSQESSCFSWWRRL